MKSSGLGRARSLALAASLVLGCRAPGEAGQTTTVTVGDAGDRMGELDSGAGDPDGGEPDASAKKEELVMQMGTPGAPAFESISGPVVDSMAKYNQSNLEYFERAERIGFLPFKGWESISAAGSVQGQSERWMNIFLTEAANPYREGARVVRWTHQHTSNTDDVLRQDIVFSAEGTSERPEQDISLRILEAADVLFITIEPPKGKEILKLPLEQRSAEASYYADRVLKRVGTFKRFMGEVKKVAYTWTFRHPPLEEGVWFSTDFTQRSSRMELWANRVDGGIRKGRLFFWCWKKPEMTSGKMLWGMDGKHWFDGEATRQLNAPHQYPPGWK